MSLESKSKELKELVSTYDTQWFLGDLSGLMKNIASDTAKDQLGLLSSPMRQLYFLGGLLISSNDANGQDIQHNQEKWDKIVILLNQIEKEYESFFIPKALEDISPEWIKIRQVAMPSFLSYFNQGPLNYEEQIINWVQNLFTPLDILIEAKTNLKTKHFIQFYTNINNLIQKKSQGFMSPKAPFNKEWLDYTKILMGVDKNAPDFIKELGEQYRPFYTIIADHGIINRFKPEDIISDNLTIEQVNSILSYLSCSRIESDYLYYTSTKPGNPLYETPIVNIENGLYQVFEIKQVIHAIDIFLEKICSETIDENSKLVEKKGKLLETKIVSIFEKFLKKDFRVIKGYYIDGFEQDILILWKNYAFIIEAKGYKLNEPFRNPEKAFVRIQRDFNESIGYGYIQTKRVEQKFVNQLPLKIEDKNGNLIEEIDTKKYFNCDFSIIVNLKSFGQIQNDLSTLLKIGESDTFPWVVKLDDLEVFLLTIIAQNKNPNFFINFLLMRENLHGKLICSDELEICGSYLSGELTENKAMEAEFLMTSPDLSKIFDLQYYKGMGFEQERHLNEKQSGQYIIR